MHKSENTSTQLHLPISEIKEDCIILKSGGLRAVIKTSSINFNLKSEEEQEAIVVSYQNFLNSLNFPIQILIKSKKLNLDDYISQVKELGDKQENKLLKEQTLEYAEYIKKLIDYADIMKKTFYVVVPYDPVRARNKGSISKFFQKLSPKETSSDIIKKDKEFQDLKKKLNQNLNVISSGLNNCGLKTERLKTEELITMLYENYNPQTSQTTQLKNIFNLNLDNTKKNLLTDSEE